MSAPPLRAAAQDQEAPELPRGLSLAAVGGAEAVTSGRGVRSELLDAIRGQGTRNALRRTGTAVAEEIADAVLNSKIDLIKSIM
eukprot:1647717-Prymnesium_polylepis.1